MGSINFFEQLAALTTHGLCAVLGNDPPAGDDPENREVVRFIPDTKILRRSIRGNNVYNVHETPLVIGDYAVIGCEGSPPDEEFGDMGVVIHSEESIARHLRVAANAVKGKRLILVSHCPPRGVLDLAIRFGTRPIGSVAVRTFLRRRSSVPLLVCGHVHHFGGKTKKLMKTLVVNAASHDDYGEPGRIAIIEMREGRVRDVQWEQILELGSIPCVRQGRAARFRDAGVRTVSEVAELTAEHIKKILNCGFGEAASIKARASALLRGELVISKHLAIPEPSRRAYIDIETDRESKFIWLIAVHVEPDQRTYAFFAETAQHEEQILAALSDFLQQRPELHLMSYSNCAFEQRLLPQRFSAHGLSPVPVESIQDVYYEIEASAAFPSKTSGLKGMAECCGFKFRHPDMDGLRAALTYGGGNVPKAVKKILLEYNEDDVLCLKHIIDYIEKHTPRSLAARA